MIARWLSSRCRLRKFMETTKANGSSSSQAPIEESYKRPLLCGFAFWYGFDRHRMSKGGDRGGAKKQKMTETEKLLRDIQTLRELIKIDWDDLASNPLREEERKNIRVHIELCQIELKNLLDRLWSLDVDNSN